MALLHSDAPGVILAAPEDWPRWAVLLPHVLAVTGYAEEAGGSLTGQAALDSSWLLDRAATYLQVHARLAEARPLMERALRIEEASYGPDHPHVALIRGHLNIAAAEPPPGVRSDRVSG
jgi:hypothetical protein